MTSWPDRLAHPGGVLAVIRLAAVPVFFAAERLVDHPDANRAAFEPVLVVVVGYAFLALAFELRGRPLARSRVLVAVDAVLIATLVATSGGPFSQLRYAFFLLPVGAALLLRPGLTAAASAAPVALYALMAVTYPNATQAPADAVGFELVQGLFLVWMGAAATLFSVLLTRRTREVSDLAAGRGRLVGQALDAEDRARRRLAEALHDDALQNLLAARQMLGSGNDGELDLVAEGLDRSVVQIREAMFDLHPYLLEQVGLRGALQAIATRAGDRGGFSVAVEVQPAAEGIHDQLIFSIARELLTNTSRHAQAATVELTVRRREDVVELAVVDDGRGVDLDHVRGAPLQGHIGLTSCAERARAIGGDFEIAPAASGRGTHVQVSLPAAVGVAG